MIELVPSPLISNQLTFTCITQTGFSQGTMDSKSLLQHIRSYFNTENENVYHLAAPLTQRDLIRLHPILNRNDDIVLTIRKHCILFILEPIRAIILSSSIFIFHSHDEQSQSHSNHALSHTNEEISSTSQAIQHFIEILQETMKNSSASSSLTSIHLELIALESLLQSVITTMSSQVQQTTLAVKSIMESLQTYYFLKSGISEKMQQVKIQTIKQAHWMELCLKRLEFLSEDDEEMELMQLSQVESNSIAISSLTRNNNNNNNNNNQDSDHHQHALQEVEYSRDVHHNHGNHHHHRNHHRNSSISSTSITSHLTTHPNHNKNDYNNYNTNATAAATHYHITTAHHNHQDNNNHNNNHHNQQQQQMTSHQHHRSSTTTHPTSSSASSASSSSSFLLETDTTITVEEIIETTIITLNGISSRIQSNLAIIENAQSTIQLRLATLENELLLVNTNFILFLCACSWNIYITGVLAMNLQWKLLITWNFNIAASITGISIIILFITARYFFQKMGIFPIRVTKTNHHRKKIN
jgi:hypothetical protein